MATLVILRGADRSLRARNLISRYQEGGFLLETDLDAGGARVLLFAALNGKGAHAVVFPDGGFICVAGVFAFRSQVGVEALRRLYESFSPSRFELPLTRGHFAVALYKNGDLYVFADIFGAVKLYEDLDGNTLATAFSAVLTGGSRPAIPDPIGCYQFAWCGGLFGRRTLAQNIRTLAPNQILRFAPIGWQRASSPPIDWRGAHRSKTIDECVGVYTERLRALFSVYRTLFSDRIRMALTGGFDSRLLLALCLDAGIVPELYIYGADTDPDVRIAAHLCKVMSLELEHIDKSRYSFLTPEEAAEQFPTEFFAFDGWADEGMLTAGVEYRDRRDRSSEGRALMIGSLGEVLRNFFDLPNARYSARQVCDAFFARYVTEYCTERFSAEAFDGELQQVMRNELGEGDGALSREQVELIYPLVRGRYWTAREAHCCLMFGDAVFPFLEPEIVRGTGSVPLAYKDLGRLECRLIEGLSPDLAKEPLVYGFAPRDRPSASYVWKKRGKQLIPPGMRRFLFNQRLKAQRDRCPTLTNAYLSQLLDTRFPVMSEYFRVRQITQSQVYRRIAVMEYIFQHFG